MPQYQNRWQENNTDMGVTDEVDVYIGFS